MEQVIEVTLASSRRACRPDPRDWQPFRQGGIRFVHSAPTPSCRKVKKSLYVRATQPWLPQMLDAPEGRSVKLRSGFVVAALDFLPTLAAKSGRTIRSPLDEAGVVPDFATSKGKPQVSGGSKSRFRARRSTKCRHGFPIKTYDKRLKGLRGARPRRPKRNRQ